MRLIAVLLLAACHRNPSPPPAPSPAAAVPVRDAFAPTTDAPAPTHPIDPAVAAEFATLAGVDVASLTPLEAYGTATIPAVVARVPADRALGLVRDGRDRFKARGYLVFRSAMNFGIGNRPDEVALIATTDQFDILRAVGTSGPNYDIDNAQVVARLRAWDARYGLVIYGAAGDYAEAWFVRPPADMNAFAAEVYAWCPDVVDQGTSSVAALAQEMKDANTLYLWWD